MYVAIPNKYSIYPEIILHDHNIMNGITINVPKWRKYIREIVLSGVEVIDMFPVFMKHKNECALFSKDHNISSLGAKLTDDMITEYINATTENLDSSYAIEHEYQNIFSYDPKPNVELARVCFVMNNGFRESFRKQYSEMSRVAIL